MSERGSPLALSAAAGCAQASQELSFIRGELIGGTEAAYGELPDWDTLDYHCDDPALGSDASAWAGLESVRGAFCARAPLHQATMLDQRTSADVLIVHGERDPYIEHTEACRFAGAAGGFSSFRQDDSGAWSTNADNPCASWTELTPGPPAAGIPGSRTFLMFEAFGHGDEGRPSLGDPCATPRPAEPGVMSYVFDFLASRRQ